MMGGMQDENLTDFVAIVVVVLQQFCLQSVIGVRGGGTGIRGSGVGDNECAQGLGGWSSGSVSSSLPEKSVQLFCQYVRVRGIPTSRMLRWSNVSVVVVVLVGCCCCGRRRHRSTSHDAAVRGVSGESCIHENDIHRCVSLPY